MERTYEAMGRLVPNEAVAVLERDEHGALVGAYKGYWNFKRGTVTLYPDMRHPFVRWSGSPVKKVVSDRVVRVRTVTSSAVAKQVSAAKREEPKGYVKSVTRSIKNLPIMGQEKMKF